LPSWGAFFDGIGREFDNLQNINQVINVDVLDGWFPPSPKVVETLRETLAWAVRASPPTESEGLVIWMTRASEI
jgi:hypothetical protein